MAKKQLIESKAINIKFEKDEEKFSASNKYGFIVIEKKTSKTWEIYNITIDSEFRMKGYGRLFVNAALEFMKEQGATGAKLWNPQIDAIPFWNKMGWEDVHKRIKI